MASKMATGNLKFRHLLNYLSYNNSCGIYTKVLVVMQQQYCI